MALQLPLSLLLLPLLQQEKRRALVLGLGPALARGLRLSRSYLALAPAALELQKAGLAKLGWCTWLKLAYSSHGSPFMLSEAIKSAPKSA